jgi:hypothetical protein
MSIRDPSRPEYFRVRDPSGRLYKISVHARGVAQVSLFGPGVLIWLVSWLVHALRFRRQWEVQVSIDPPGLGFLWNATGDVVIYEGYTSRAEATDEMRSVAGRIVNGTWQQPPMINI